MTKTSWSRCSKVALACLVVLVTAAAPAAAVSVGENDVPSDAQVGSKVTASVTLDELYKNPQLESWTLAGSTELEDVTWTVTYYDQTGAKVGQESFDGQNFSGASVVADDGTSEVEVSVSGTAPEVESYAYDPAQSFTVLSLEQTRSGGSTNAIDSWSARHFTEESQSARNALDEAQAVVADSGSEEAQDTFEKAVSAFESGNSFDLATELAGDAQSQAQQAQQSSQTKQMAIYAAGGLLALGAVVGAVFYWRSQQTGYDKLG